MVNELNMKKQFLLFCFCLAAVCAFAQSKQEKAVQARVDALTKAVFQTQDSAAYYVRVSEKVSYGHSGGSLVDKAAMVRNAVASKTVYRNFSYEPVSFTLVNKKTATHR